MTSPIIRIIQFVFLLVGILMLKHIDLPVWVEGAGLIVGLVAIEFWISKVKSSEKQAAAQTKKEEKGSV